MKIVALDLFDLYGNGTLVMRTVVDQPSTALRYTWYIKKNGKNIYKGHYQRNPYMAFQLEHLGTYTVKAYVWEGKGEAMSFEADFTANKRTSPELAKTIEQNRFQITPVVTHISGAFWEFSLEEDFGEDAQFAWYVYQADNPEPVSKQMYSSESRMVHQFEQPGNYYVKAFVIKDDVKCSACSQVFTVA